MCQHLVIDLCLIKKKTKKKNDEKVLFYFLNVGIEIFVKSLFNANNCEEVVFNMPLFPFEALD